MEKANLTRIRDNQRRSRARRKEYIQELERRLRIYERKGVEASSEIQQAARKVAEDNKRLRALLGCQGFSDERINGFLHNDSVKSSEPGHREAFSPVSAVPVCTAGYFPPSCGLSVAGMVPTVEALGAVCDDESVPSSSILGGPASTTNQSGFGITTCTAEQSAIDLVELGLKAPPEYSPSASTVSPNAYFNDEARQRVPDATNLPCCPVRQLDGTPIIATVGQTTLLNLFGIDGIIPMDLHAGQGVGALSGQVGFMPPEDMPLQHATETCSHTAGPSA
ncbi:hypothetical protein F4780DRAFT_204400 [Xylariomycetidae sp. FL0641]|nr:hypothetical protein F4780DRAFT_204400 [Xylariomycetidae sp. FL0641]